MAFKYIYRSPLRSISSAVSTGGHSDCKSLARIFEA
jgi:hypothetical protein